MIALLCRQRPPSNDLTTFPQTILRSRNHREEGGVKGFLPATVVALAIPAGMAALPLNLAGYDFQAGEEAFADDAAVVSGTVTGATSATVFSTLVGSNLGDSIRVITPDVAVIEVSFLDNVIVNGPGADLIVFELSGASTPVGFADANERFEISVLNGSDFSPFQEFVPVNTGFLAPHDPSLSAYVVEIDLSDFGLAVGETTQSIRLRLVDHLVSRSADPTALGALNSLPVPEPSTGLLSLFGITGLVVRRRQMNWSRRGTNGPRATAPFGCLSGLRKSSTAHRDTGEAK